MLYPLTFHPLFKERIWGGRNIERLYGKQLPANVTIGESWEISDRPDDVSIVANGPLAGKSLRWLMENHVTELLGAAHSKTERFPLLVKILDAQEKLSLQVHPPADVAKRLGGEPKTEMWYMVDTAATADLFVGFKHGVTRAEVERRLRDGTVAECFHRIKTKVGDAMFLPSGRVHSIGAGNVLFEIQQNSDTTYRVFDWNRVDADGKPRDLHVEQSLASINFNDFEPSLIQSEYSRSETISVRYLVDDPPFRVDAWRVKRGERFHLRNAAAQIIGIIAGRLTVQHAGMEVRLKSGEFCLLPASLERVTLVAEARIELLHVQLP